MYDDDDAIATWLDLEKGIAKTKTHLFTASGRDETLLNFQIYDFYSKILHHHHHHHHHHRDRHDYHHHPHRRRHRCPRSFFWTSAITVSSLLRARARVPPTARSTPGAVSILMLLADDQDAPD